MIVLDITHIIHLTRQQRYDLVYKKETILVCGLSYCVWCQDGVSSEPAKEIFCQYLISVEKEHYPIRILSDGYQITLPLRKKKKPLPIGIWRCFTRDQLSYYNDCVNRGLLDARNLLDPVSCLSYKESNKIESTDAIINHCVNIEDISVLKESLVLEN